MPSSKKLWKLALYCNRFTCPCTFHAVCYCESGSFIVKMCGGSDRQISAQLFKTTNSTKPHIGTVIYFSICDLLSLLINISWEAGIKQVLYDVFIAWWNAFSYRTVKTAHLKWCYLYIPKSQDCTRGLCKVHSIQDFLSLDLVSHFPFHKACTTAE